MPEVPTPNYGLAKPKNDGTESMASFDVWLNPNWVKIEDAPAPNSGTTLPTSGTYNIGDRFYKTDTKSIYILIVKDADWGWLWRPVHDAISPWFTIPSTAINTAGWSVNSVAGNPFQIAFDNRGYCYWRGILGVTSGTFARNTNHTVLKVLPDGIRPSRNGVWMVGHETLAVGTDGTNLTAYQGARVFLSKNPSGLMSVRGFGGTADFARIHLTGIMYASGNGSFTTV